VTVFIHKSIDVSIGSIQKAEYEIIICSHQKISGHNINKYLNPSIDEYALDQ